MTIHVRRQTPLPADREAVRAINAEAFGRPDEADLVEALQDAGLELASLVAEAEDAPVGHILFTWLETEGPLKAAALAPMAVRPGQQKSGVGAALIAAGLDAARQAGAHAVIVLGHPDYYPRFGFSAALAKRVDAPFSGEAFMALELVPGALAGGAKIGYPPVWGV
jgi:putative acetyltransferase